MVNTSKLIFATLYDYLFDFRHGTDTCQPVELDELTINSANTTHGSPYESSKAHDLKKLFRHFHFPKDSVLVDLGSGKGKVLLATWEFKFKKVIGIEFSEELTKIAKRNIEIFEKKKGKRPVEVICADALKYNFNGDENVFFMFNPFGAPVIEGFIARLQESIEKSPRKVWFIYRNPTQRNVFDKNPKFKLVKKITSMGTEYLIYIYGI
ncbi:MAG: hypothetical protein A4S09_00320 [Proteobacteria bacterium SG_bin7]|nr:MAG: hypothetical protein A4S09_00320 [Proteobacteria bacterium SG_bin7]